MSYDEKRFSDLIYDILRQSDLETVSAKKIRNALSEKLGYDVSEHKVSLAIYTTPSRPNLTLRRRKRSNV
jgi:upstream activation factor subunit UAF30